MKSRETSRAGIIFDGHADIVPRLALTARVRGVESYNLIFSAPRTLRVTPLCDFDERISSSEIVIDIRRILKIFFSLFINYFTSKFYKLYRSEK